MIHKSASNTNVDVLNHDPIVVSMGAKSGSLKNTCDSNHDIESIGKQLPIQLEQLLVGKNQTCDNMLNDESNDLDFSKLIALLAFSNYVARFRSLTNLHNFDEQLNISRFTLCDIRSQAYSIKIEENRIKRKPMSYIEAITFNDLANWKLAMDEEYNSLVKIEMWNLIQVPKRRILVKLQINVENKV